MWVVYHNPNLPASRFVPNQTPELISYALLSSFDAKRKKIYRIGRQALRNWRILVCEHAVDGPARDNLAVPGVKVERHIRTATVGHQQGAVSVKIGGGGIHVLAGADALDRILAHIQLVKRLERPVCGIGCSRLGIEDRPVASAGGPRLAPFRFWLDVQPFRFGHRLNPLSRSPGDPQKSDHRTTHMLTFKSCEHVCQLRFTNVHNRYPHGRHRAPSTRSMTFVPPSTGKRHLPFPGKP